MHNKRIKVAIVINDVLRAGAQRIILDLVRTADRRAFEFVVISMKADEVFVRHSTPTLRADIEKAGVRVIYVSQNLRFSFPDAKKLYSILRAEKPDIIHTYLPYAGILGRVVGRLARVPHIVSMQCNVRVAYDFRGYWMDRLTLPLADAWTAAAESIELEYGGSVENFSETLWNAGRRHYTITAGVDCDAIQKIRTGLDRAGKRREFGIGERDVMLMMTARLVSWKGHNELIEAMPLLPKNVHLCLVGWGERENELKEMAQDRGVIERVHFLGSRNDVYELLGASDIYVQSFSRTKEGRMWMGPNAALMEAAAAEVPIVTTNVPLIERLVQDGVTGKVANVNDPQSLAAAILWLIEHPAQARQMAQKAAKLARERYSVASMVRAYAGLYTALCSPSAG